MNECMDAICTEPKAPGRGRHYCDLHQADAIARRRLDSIKRVQQWASDNAERHRLINRAAIYGLTADDLIDMLEYQQGNCAICGDFGGLELEIDHDHITERVRGLLCGTCNKLLANAHDMPHILEAAIAYLVHPIWQHALESTEGTSL